MSNVFQSISSKRPLSSKFDLSHTRKFSFRPGKLYPILCAEAVPSDLWQYDSNALVRMMPMLAPIMHMVDVCVHSFFYPFRLCMERNKWEVFITGGQAGDGKDAQGNTIQIPYFRATSAAVSSATGISVPGEMGVGSLADFLGIQFSKDSDFSGDNGTLINAMPFIAFWRIWCEYFRDPNLDVNYVDVYPNIFDSPGGDLTAAIYTAFSTIGTNQMPFFSIPAVCWEKDYFTSALPFAQRGNAVEAPLTGTGTVVYKPVSDVFQENGDPPFADGNVETNTANQLLVPGSAGDQPGRVENIDQVNLTAGGFTITALRTAARLQEWLEKMATGGSRYIEQIRAVFGVTSRDSRLQRAEYLGGGKIPMHINEVVQTSETGDTPLAEMAGHGVTAGQVTSFRKFAEEHGLMFSFIYLRPKTAYQQGLPRMWWNRFDKLDYAWLSFARIGEQEVLQKELYFQCDPEFDDEVFGYQQRYAEYKYIPSTVHGDFRTSLDYWHWGRIFNTNPSLSPSFVHCDPDPRIFNILSEGSDELYCIVNNRITARRPLPYYGEPHL